MTARVGFVLSFLALIAPAQTKKARLGEMHFSSLVGGTVGSAGEKFVCELIEEGGRILSVEVGVTPAQSPRLLKALRFTVRNPGQPPVTKTCGSPAGALWEKPFVVLEGRRVVGVSGATGWMVDNLRVHLDDGTTSPLHGGEGGDTAFQLLLNRSRQGRWKGELRGFWGATADGALESIGLMFWPLE